VSSTLCFTCNGVRLSNSCFGVLISREAMGQPWIRSLLTSTVAMPCMNGVAHPT
jgi:hypothetical protein